jgi:diaminopimelate epimerase
MNIIRNNTIKSCTIKIYIGSNFIRDVECELQQDNDITACVGVYNIHENTVQIGNDHKIILTSQINAAQLPVPYTTVPDDKYNVSYVHVRDNCNLYITTIERGTGKTLTCGSGVSAAFAWCLHNNLVVDKVFAHTEGSVAMGIPIMLYMQNNNIYISSQCNIVFTGQLLNIIATYPA